VCAVPSRGAAKPQPSDDAVPKAIPISRRATDPRGKLEYCLPVSFSPGASNWMVNATTTAAVIRLTYQFLVTCP
jgi:hypothetical protein